MKQSNIVIINRHILKTVSEVLPIKNELRGDSTYFDVLIIRFSTISSTKNSSSLFLKDTFCIDC